MPSVEGFANNTYEFMGGPLDGQAVALPDDKRSYTITQPILDRICPPDEGPIPIRTGIYKVKRHPTKGYVLSWIGWVENT